MKATLLSVFTIPALGILSSCTPPTTAPGAPPLSAPGTVAQGSNPYGVPQANPYGAPSPGYTPQSPAPYQPVNPPAAAPYSPPAPAPYNSAPSSGGAKTHTIVKGESLWGISRKYGVTVDGLRQANSMTGDTIIEGRSLIIPSN